MNTRQRKQRQFEQRETLILDQARELANREGVAALQMSRLAEASEYATGTVYQHFSSKEDLIVALTTRGIREYLRMHDRILQWEATPRDRMVAMIVAAAQYIRRNPAHIQLLQSTFTGAVWNHASENRRDDFVDSWRGVISAFDTIIDQAAARGDLQPGRVSATHIAFGPCTISIGTYTLSGAEGLLGKLEVRNPVRMMYSQIQIYLNGLEWQPLFPIDDEKALDALVRRIEQEVFGSGSDPASVA